MARRLVHPRYAGLVSDQATFAHEVSTLHRRLTSLSDTAGGWQVPWPRAVGTPPWAVARELRLLTGVAYAVRPVRLRRHVWRHLDGASPERPVAVYVGDRLLPRHVVLVTGIESGRARTYEPSSGRHPVDRPGPLGARRARARRLGPPVAGGQPRDDRPAR